MANSNLKHKVFMGTFWTLLEQLGAKCAALVVEIVLARILLPEEYGIVAIAAVFVTIVNTITCDGLSLALVQKEHADNVDFSTGFFLNLCISIVMYIAVFFAAPLIGEFYNSPELAGVLRVLGLFVPVSSINSVQRAYATREMLFKRFFVSSTVGYVLSGAISIALAYCGFGVWALVAQTILAALFDTAILWFTVRWRPSLVFSLDRLRGLWSFGWKVLLSNLLYQVCIQLRAAVIGKKYTSSDLAFFNRGELIPALVSCTADKAMQTALFPAMSKVQSDISEVRGMLSRFVKVGCYVIFPSMVALAVVAVPLVEVVFTEKWLPCVPFIWAFCACYALQTLQSASLLALRAIGRSGTTLVQDCIKRLIDLLLLAISIPFGPVVIACSCLVSAVIAVIVNTVPCKRVFSYGLLSQLRDVAPIVLMSAVSGLAAASVSLLSLSATMCIIAQIIVIVGIYFSLSAVTKNDSFGFVVSIVRGMFGRNR